MRALSSGPPGSGCWRGCHSQVGGRRRPSGRSSASPMPVSGGRTSAAMRVSATRPTAVAGCRRRPPPSAAGRRAGPGLQPSPRRTHHWTARARSGDGLRTAGRVVADVGAMPGISKQQVEQGIGGGTRASAAACAAASVRAVRKSTGRAPQEAREGRRQAVADIGHHRHPAAGEPNPSRCRRNAGRASQHSGIRPSGQCRGGAGVVLVAVSSQHQPPAGVRFQAKRDQAHARIVPRARPFRCAVQQDG